MSLHNKPTLHKFRLEFQRRWYQLLCDEGIVFDSLHHSLCFSFDEGVYTCDVSNGEDVAVWVVSPQDNVTSIHLLMRLVKEWLDSVDFNHILGLVIKDSKRMGKYGTYQHLKPSAPNGYDTPLPKITKKEQEVLEACCMEPDWDGDAVEYGQLPWTQTDLARRTGIEDKSNLHKLLSSLVDKGLLIKIPSTDHVYMGIHDIGHVEKNVFRYRCAMSLAEDNESLECYKDYREVRQKEVWDKFTKMLK
ncbi:MarR family transcriptional regulator [Vibrio cholerae]|uniref:MarR family transcriptional regulator n=1 Tax=Vibrio cholerae TaxID=666 RepID=UPI0011D42F42|nr:helix-turn-helix domain-containing protein [Vibrio cholerae]TXX49216.1 MarR family transcriptional regulator [Vibrio cholerae]